MADSRCEVCGNGARPSRLYAITTSTGFASHAEVRPWRLCGYCAHDMKRDYPIAWYGPYAHDVQGTANV